MTKKEALFVHFRREEHPFVERVLDWTYLVAQRGQRYLTPFLDPRQQQIVQMLANRESDLTADADGGYSEAERQRLLLFPLFDVPEEGDFQLAFFRLHFSAKAKVGHREILGSLLALGIKREMVGDLLIQNNSADLVVAAEISDYIRASFEKVGRSTVRMETIEQKELIIPERTFETWKVSVASLRLDAVVAEGFRLSRSKAVQLIRSGKCQVNWIQMDDPSTPVDQQDVISIRGFGRIYLHEIAGTSKKRRIWIRLGKIKDND